MGAESDWDDWDERDKSDLERDESDLEWDEEEFIDSETDEGSLLSVNVSSISNEKEDFFLVNSAAPSVPRDDVHQTVTPTAVKTKASLAMTVDRREALLQKSCLRKYKGRLVSASIIALTGCAIYALSEVSNGKSSRASKV